MKREDPMKRLSQLFWGAATRPTTGALILGGLAVALAGTGVVAFGGACALLAGVGKLVVYDMMFDTEKILTQIYDHEDRKEREQAEALFERMLEELSYHCSQAVREVRELMGMPGTITLPAADRYETSDLDQLIGIQTKGEEAIARAIDAVAPLHQIVVQHGDPLKLRDKRNELLRRINNAHAEALGAKSTLASWDSRAKMAAKIDDIREKAAGLHEREGARRNRNTEFE